MKKLVYVISICLMVIMLCACHNNEPKELANMTTKDCGEYTAVVWENRDYIPFCAISNRERGTQLGEVDKSDENQIYEYRGQSTDNWIILSHKNGSIYRSTLMKEKNVKKIPNGLKSPYDWNN